MSPGADSGERGGAETSAGLTFLLLTHRNSPTHGPSEGTGSCLLPTASALGLRLSGLRALDLRLGVADPGSLGDGGLRMHR